jgi:hypothetical protein
MANPEYVQDSIKKMKQPGAAIVGRDSSVLSEGIGIHNTTPPNLADGDFKQLQLDDQGNLKTAMGDAAQESLLEAITPFSIPPFDEIILTYSGSNVSIVTYNNSSIEVATLTLTYSGDNITRVVKS